jgi:hypothetical protein
MHLVLLMMFINDVHWMPAREWLQLLPAMALVYWFGRAQIDLHRQQEFISASSDLAELSPGASLGPVSHNAQPADGASETPSATVERRDLATSPTSPHQLATGIISRRMGADNRLI